MGNNIFPIDEYSKKEKSISVVFCFRTFAILTESNFLTKAILIEKKEKVSNGRLLTHN